MEIYKNGSIRVSKKELIKAFELWYGEQLDNPTSFEYEYSLEDNAKECYNTLIQYLNNQHGK